MPKKFDPFAIDRRLKAKKDPTPKSETFGTRLMRIVVGLLTVSIVWSLFDFYNTSTTINTVVVFILAVCFAFYLRWVFKK